LASIPVTAKVTIDRTIAELDAQNL
jgi:hypothetical protein